MTVKPETFIFNVTEAETGQRLDRYVVLKQPDLSRNYVQQLITDHHVRINGRGSKPSYPVQAGDKVELVLPLAQPTDIIAEDLPLDVVYEDADVLVINKPAGMVVHPAPGHATGTLVNALLYHYPKLTTSGDLRPGIVHRLDKDTSGLIVVARHDQARELLTRQQKDRVMSKRYLTLVEGHFKEPHDLIDAPIARHPHNRLRMAVVAEGRYARTHYTVLAEYGPFSLLNVKLETGRTHQIRVHFAYKNRFVVGDPLYTSRSAKDALGLKRQFLHAYELGFHLPSDGTWRVWQVGLPADLRDVLAKLGQRYPPQTVIPFESPFPLW